MEDDPTLSRLILEKFYEFHQDYFTQVAKTAHENGRSKLAIKVKKKFFFLVFLLIQKK